MDSLAPTAEKIAGLLRARGESLAVAESSTGGLIAASLLAIPGASDYFLGAAVVYTVNARSGLLAITPDDMKGFRAASEPYALLLAERARERLGAVWGLSETGAAGPTGNRYGDAAGHSCIAVSGPRSRVLTLETASADRRGNMRVFALHALTALAETIEAAR
ncbi:MAG: CinA family protein [Hyphomicrobiaceae bacterium]